MAAKQRFCCTNHRIYANRKAPDKQGATQQQQAAKKRQARHTEPAASAQPAQEAKDQAVTIDWASLPGNQREKLDRAKAFIRKQLERELRAEANAEAEQYRAQCDANVAAYKAQLDARAQSERARRDEERERYKTFLDAHRAKGLITPDEYRVIWSCLHPDSRASASDQKLAKAFRLFNNERVKALLVKEVGKPQGRRK
jgi:hypothetical protein